jgi:hypothetical protein
MIFLSYDTCPYYWMHKRELFGLIFYSISFNCVFYDSVSSDSSKKQLIFFGETASSMIPAYLTIFMAVIIKSVGLDALTSTAIVI